MDSYLEVKVIEASFLKDHDMFGKQDPYITFLQGDKLCRTKTADDAGKHAVFNESFKLDRIQTQLEADDEVTFQAFDEDIGSSDFLGQTKPFPYLKFCQTEKAQEFEFDLFMKKQK